MSAPKQILLPRDESKINKKGQYRKNMKPRKPTDAPVPPTRPWRSPQQEKAARESKKVTDKLQEAAGGRGSDVRSPINADQGTMVGQLVPQTVTSVNQVVSIKVTQVANLALGLVNISLKHGQSINQVGGNTAYVAWCYLTQSLINVMLAATVDIQSAPRWYWEIAAAVKPKTVAFKTGSISYKWSMEGGDASYYPPQIFPLGSSDYVFGTANTTNSVNGFPTLDSNVVYTVEQGKDALSTLFQLFPNRGMYERIGDPGSSCFLSNDASAFQACYPEWGTSLDNVSGVASSVLSEVPLLSPILSKFALYQDLLYRGFQDMRRSGGSPQYIIPKIANSKKIYAVRSKVPPIFKYYNFDLFFVKLSYTLGQALEILAKDNSQVFPGACPLTPWEVQMILRQVLISQTNNEMANDLYLNGPQDIALIPFVTGNNGVAITSEAFVSPKFPMLFAENLRACTRIEAKAGKGERKVHMDFVPIIARPLKAVVPTLGNFEYQDQNGDYQPIYNATRVSVDVDFIDLSYTSGNVKYYLTPNADAYGALVEMWNNWITKLGSELIGLTTVGAERGIPLLRTVVNTAHLIYLAPANPQQQVANNVVQKQPSKKALIVGDALKREEVKLPRPTPGTSSTYYTTVAISSLTGTQAFYNVAWKYLRTFVHPVTFASFAPVLDAALTFQQTMQMEPNKIVLTPSEQISAVMNSQVTTIDSLLRAGSSLDIKTNLAAPSEVQVEMNAMAQMGEGGLFASLAGIVGGAFGVPGVQQFVEGLGM